MLSRFYKRYSTALLWFVVLSTPYLFIEADSVPANNNIETWLPQDSPVRATYEQFKRDFGVEEVILIGVERSAADDTLVESICGRLDRLPGVRCCWSPDRLQTMMGEMGVSRETAHERLKGLAFSTDDKLLGVVVLLSNAGIRDRAGTVNDIRRELDYCRMQGDQICLSGGPVLITELDRLGGLAENQKFFIVTLLLCAGLLYYWTKDWKLSLSVLGLTIWAINLTLTIFKFCGGEMNFILGALSVMVMVFTLEAAIHVIHYYKASLGKEDPLGEALRLCWKPCLVSMLTTTIGLFSVSVTDILPVTHFGYASTLGAVVAIVVGIALTPALLTVLPPVEVETVGENGLGFGRLANWLLGHHKVVTVAALGLAIVGFLGLARIKTKIDPLDFLPKDGKVLADVHRIQNELTNLDSIEAVIDFGDSDLPFAARLSRVRELEQTIRRNPAVRHTLSAASFFPDELPENPLALVSLLQRAESKKSNNDFLVGEQQLWRISSRINVPAGKTLNEVHRDLERQTAGQPIHFTGIAPLLEQAQREIFDGFWKSFAAAFIVIGVVMAIALRSVKIMLLAMIPNLVPLGIVFGTLGWIGFPVDIGMMMTGSIALGISIDGTFHFLVRYLEQTAEGRSNAHAVRVALITTGGPIFESIVVSSIGMLALALSSFAPTVRFGVLMATLLMATLAGDLLLLPALLAWRRVRRPGTAEDLQPTAPGRLRSVRPARSLAADRVA
ncbi:MAG: RND transporter [Planctomycetaceae bacterium]|nr:RND transporter [Planctomycetaceae bacterium]